MEKHIETKYSKWMFMQGSTRNFHLTFAPESRGEEKFLLPSRTKFLGIASDKYSSSKESENKGEREEVGKIEMGYGMEM